MRRTVTEHQAAVQAQLARCWDAMPTAVKYDAGTPVTLSMAVGRVLAQDVVAPLDLPPFANSQMDGYAVNAAAAEAQGSEAAEPQQYTIAAVVAAGAVPEPLQAGTAAPIMTGAMMPPGATAVIPIEAAQPNHFGAHQSVLLPTATPGTFVRAQGSDVRRGDVVISAGTVLNAAHMGLAAALGFTELPVRRFLRALLLTTGDEVLAPGAPETAGGLPPGMIFDANQSLLRACLAQAGVEVVHAESVRDEPAALLRVLERHIPQAAQDDAGSPATYDLIISVGGISAGAFEVVKQALGGAEQHVTVDFLSVAMQPGGPQGLGSYQGVPFLGFPGNPVSAFVSFEMFLRPALTALVGAPLVRPRVVATLEHPLTSPAGKHQVRRGIYSGPEFESAQSVREVGGESSHLLGALGQANALFHVPAGSTELQAGAKVEVWLL